jgi:6-pyruvoyl-tetrahydropterin synthase
MEEKFKLSIQIRDEVSKANDAVIKIRTLKEKMKTELSTAKPKRINELNKFIQEISTIEENLYQVRNQSSQDPLNFPIKLNNKLAALMRIVESGDCKPTDGSYKVFAELKVELATELNHLDLLLSPKKG